MSDRDNTQDWGEIKALRASLREHMAEIHRLRVAGRQALDALEHAVEQLRWQSIGQAQHDFRSALKPVTDCHDKEGDKLSPPLDAPETNFGNMAQAVDPKEADHIADTNKMVASINEMETVEPVAWAVVGDGKFGKYELGNHFESEVQPNFKYWENRGYELIPLYTAPPKREPLTDEEIDEIFIAHGRDKETFARAIERAHGIGGEE